MNRDKCDVKDVHDKEDAHLSSDLTQHSITAFSAFLK